MITYKLTLGISMEDGSGDMKCKSIDIPYAYHEKVWYCYRKRKKYVVRESRVFGIWATNCAGVTLDNNWYISSDAFHRLFNNEDDAIEFCLKQNQKATVKVYYLGRSLLDA